MINLDTLEHWKRHKPALLGFLLVVVGFVGGYFSRGFGHHPQPSAPPHARALSGPTAIEMHWHGRQPDATVIVIQDGQVARYRSATMTPAAAPRPEKNHSGLLLAVLLLCSMPGLVLAALAWNRRRNRVTFAEPDPYYPDFVPRRDD